MKITIATPVAKRSAIGRVSADVARELARRGHVVRIIATELEAPTEPIHAFVAGVAHWTDDHAADVLADTEMLVVNFGDNYLFHAGVFALMGRAPTLGVFHDFYMYNLFNGWLWAGGLRSAADQERLRALTLAETYGAQALETVGKQISLAELAELTPMTEWVAARCDGALAHARFYLPRLSAGCPGPVGHALMPFAGRDVPPLKVRASQAVTVLTVGVMNANKCVDRVIAAIGASPTLTGVVAYRLVGPIEPAEADRLATLAAEAGVDLAIHGAVADQELDAHLAAADVICCLRNPVLEGSSASAIEAMLAGRPLIVADAGFYGELPDELVFKVAADVPVADIMQALERLVADEPLRRRIGGKARAWAERSFSLAGYAQALEDLAGETLRALPVLSVGRQIGAELAGFGLGAQDAAIDRIGATLAEILPTV